MIQHIVFFSRFLFFSLGGGAEKGKTVFSFFLPA
jgi:hypothetical protein